MQLTRRIVGKLFGSAAVAIPVAHGLDLSRPLNRFRAYDGTLHDLSAAQATRLNAAFGVGWPTWENAQARRVALQRLSQERYDRGENPLTDAERREMYACDEVCNMNNSLRLMRGRDYREVFGPDATLDQVHHNQISATCGCVVNLIFDHNRRHEGPPVHPHHLTRSCDAHAHLAHDFRRHFEAVTRATG